MSGLHIADTGVFVVMGQPSNRRYEVVRWYARRNDVTFVLPQRVYEKRSWPSTIPRSITLDTRRSRSRLQAPVHWNGLEDCDACEEGEDVELLPKM